MRGDFSVQGYEVEGLLAAGASGEVWLARVQATGEQVALKRLQASGSEIHESTRRLVATLTEMAHPHVLRVRDLVAQDDEIVVVADYAEGGSLAQLLLARATLDPGEVVTTVAPVAEAVEAAHQRQLVHGDITPETICYTPQGLPLLADLGVLSAGAVDPEAVGTHGYTDPLAPREAGLTPAGDVYSLAAVCYAALTGEAPPPPHERRPLHELAPGVPPGLAHAVEAGLQGDPARRPSAGQFADLLYGATQPAPVRFPMGLVMGGAAAAGSSDPFGTASAASPGAGAPDAGPAGPSDPSGGAASPSPEPAAGFAGAQQAPPVLGAGAATTSWRLLDDGDEDDEPSRRRRLIVAIAAGAVVLVGLVVGGIVWATSGSDDPEAGPAAAQRDPTPSGDGQEDNAEPEPDQTSAPPPPDDPALREWWDVLTELDARRAQAFAEADPDLLSGVYTDDAVVLRGDSEDQNDRLKVQAFADADSVAEGVTFHIHDLEVLDEQNDEVVLRVVDQLQPYTVVGPDDEREPVPAGEVTTRTFTLRQVDGEWRIYNITPGSAG